jgi:hypothetical protein
VSPETYVWVHMLNCETYLMVVFLPIVRMLTSDDSGGTRVSTSLPSTRPRPTRQSIISKLNDFIHRDYITDFVFYGFWLGFWVFMPPVILLGTLLLAVYDLITARGYRQPCGPVLVTGCDTGFGKALALALAERHWKVRPQEAFRKGSL